MASNQPLYLLFGRRPPPELGLPEFWQDVSGALLTFAGDAQCLDACERYLNQKPNNGLKRDAANPRTSG